MAIGDHLIVDFGWYRHHGIDVGNGEVVHFGRGLHDIESAVIEKVSRSEFSQNRPIELANSKVLFTPEEVCQRALSRLGERGYHIERNNCEHFVSWCRTGQSVSTQSDLGETLARQTVSAITKPALALTMVSTAVRAGSCWAGKSLSPLLVKSIGKATPILMAADAIQAATELVATRSGCDKQKSRRIGRRTGSAMSAAVGLAIAGPGGAAATLATWLASQKFSEQVLGKLSERLHREPSSESDR